MYGLEVRVETRGNKDTVIQSRDSMKYREEYLGVNGERIVCRKEDSLLWA